MIIPKGWLFSFLVIPVSNSDTDAAETGRLRGEPALAVGGQRKIDRGIGGQAVAEYGIFGIERLLRDRIQTAAKARKGQDLDQGSNAAGQRRMISRVAYRAKAKFEHALERIRRPGIVGGIILRG